LRFRNVATAAIRLNSSAVRSDAAVSVKTRSTVYGGLRRTSSGPETPPTTSSWATFAE
jgi:hypothetical protein